MPLPVYDSQKIYIALRNMQRELDDLIAHQCPDEPLLLEEGLDTAMNNFLSRQHFEGNEVSLLTTQYALIRLRSELARAKDVVVEVNDLQAVQDYDESRSKGKIVQMYVPHKTSVRYISASIGVVLALGALFWSLYIFV